MRSRFMGQLLSFVINKLGNRSLRTETHVEERKDITEKTTICRITQYPDGYREVHIQPYYDPSQIAVEITQSHISNSH